jgi:hypothetical protein
MSQFQTWLGPVATASGRRERARDALTRGRPRCGAEAVAAGARSDPPKSEGPYTPWSDGVLSLLANYASRQY